MSVNHQSIVTTDVLRNDNNLRCVSAEKGSFPIYRLQVLSSVNLAADQNNCKQEPQ